MKLHALFILTASLLFASVGFAQTQKVKSKSGLLPDQIEKNIQLTRGNIEVSQKLLDKVLAKRVDAEEKMNSARADWKAAGKIYSEARTDGGTEADSKYRDMKDVNGGSRKGLPLMVKTSPEAKRKISIARNKWEAKKETLKVAERKYDDANRAVAAERNKIREQHSTEYRGFKDLAKSLTLEICKDTVYYLDSNPPELSTDKKKREREVKRAIEDALSTVKAKRMEGFSDLESEVRLSRLDSINDCKRVNLDIMALIDFDRATSREDTKQ